MPSTTNYNFTLLNGSDTAGYSSINTVITSIDNALQYKTNITGMIMVFDSSVYSPPAAPTGWANLGTTIVNSGLPALTSPYIYIKKS